MQVSKSITVLVMSCDTMSELQKNLHNSAEKNEFSTAPTEHFSNSCVATLPCEITLHCLYITCSGKYNI